MTKDLSWLFFVGQGDKYLGFRFADREKQPDGSWKILPQRWDAEEKRFVANYDHPEHWTVEKSHSHWRSSAFLSHLQAKHRGLVATDDSGCTDVPFIASDLDRHHNEPAKQHIERVIRTLRACIRLYPHLRWLAEVNNKNGSTKLYGISHKGIPICRAKEVAKELYQVVVQITGNPKTEVFPHNMTQILLPCRADKTTIIDTGILSKVQRYKVVNGKRVYYDAYSMIELYGWMNRSGQCDESTLQQVLENVCKCPMRDIADVKYNKPVNRLEELKNEAYLEAMGLKERESLPLPLSSLRSDKDRPLGRPPQRSINGGLGPDGVPSPTSLDDIRSTANAFDRKRLFTQWLSRHLRRVPTLEEVLSAYKSYKMYGGSWDDNLGKRRSDFVQIIKYVERSFNSELCGQGKSHRPELNKEVMKWRGRMTAQFMLGKTYSVIINQTVRYDEYGNRIVSDGKQRYVNGQHLSYVMGIVAYVMLTSQRGDGSIRRKSIQGWWEDLAKEGKLPAWSVDYWLACRQVLEDIGWIVVDDTYSHREHRSKTAEITYSDQPLVGTIYAYPTTTYNYPPTSIMVVTHSSPEKSGSSDKTTPRPPPRGQPPPIRRFTPSKQEQNSWN